MSESFDEIVPEKRRNDEFSAWRKVKAKAMPELAARVFALRGVRYAGSGFHWSLEKCLGYCMGQLNDYDDHTLYYGPDAASNQIVLEVLIEGLEESIAKAEGKTVSTLDNGRQSLTGDDDAIPVNQSGS